MPNWCEGNIRFRGKPESIKKFLLNELKIVGLIREDDYSPIVKDEYDELSIEIPEIEHRNYAQFYIKGTHRNFIDSREIYAYICSDDECATVCIEDFKAAWAIESAPYLAHSKNYGIDIKIVGFEKGMEFSQLIEIVNGEITEDKEYKYEDWDWESLQPNYGG
jgi:hypothetical protein